MILHLEVQSESSDTLNTIEVAMSAAWAVGMAKRLLEAA